MKRWRWVGLKLVYAIHDRQLAEHGGLDGVRDEAAIDSALERPPNLYQYEPDIDAAGLVARYTFAIARNHGFADGNKRTAWVVARVFLIMNGYALSFDAAEAVRTVEAVAAGQVKESQLAEWFRARISRASRK